MIVISNPRYLHFKVYPNIGWQSHCPRHWQPEGEWFEGGGWVGLLKLGQTHNRSPHVQYTHGASTETQFMRRRWRQSQLSESWWLWAMFGDVNTIQYKTWHTIGLVMFNTIQYKAWQYNIFSDVNQLKTHWQRPQVTASTTVQCGDEEVLTTRVLRVVSIAWCELGLISHPSFIWILKFAIQIQNLVWRIPLL